MSEFFQMGGYASYIWPAYGVSAAALIALIIWSVRANREAKARLAQLEEGKTIYDKSAKPGTDPTPAEVPATANSDGEAS